MVANVDTSKYIGRYVTHKYINITYKDVPTNIHTSVVCNIAAVEPVLSDMSALRDSLKVVLFIKFSWLISFDRVLSFDYLYRSIYAK